MGLESSIASNHFVLWVGGSVLITTVVFWLFNGVLLFIDFMKPGPIANWFRQYKVQETKNVPLSFDKFMSAARIVLFNQLVVGTLVQIATYPLAEKRGITTLDKPFPRGFSLIRAFLICIAVEEVFFYYFHRLMHHPVLFKRFHYIHHEWKAPIGIIGIYNHPVEHLLTNLVPAVVSVFLVNSGIKFAWVFFCVGECTTSISHCGYHFPFFPSSQAHDFHHLRFTNCFGFLGILDWLHGTDLNFKATINYQRNRTLWCLTPITEIYPDAKKVDKHHPHYPPSSKNE